jgi:CRP-like cAMP-binding protein
LKPEFGHSERSHHRGVIDPFNGIKVKWDMIVAVLIIYSVVSVPFRIGFMIEAEGVAAIIDAVVDCLFAIDILLTFFTGYHDDRSRLITSHRLIGLRYLKGLFIIDFVSTLPVDILFELVSPGSSGASARLVRILRLTRLFKLARLFRLKRLTSLLEEMDFITLHHIQLLKVIGVVVFLIHMLACACYWITTPVCPDGSQEPCTKPIPPEDRPWSSWAVMFHVDQMNLGSRYVATVHFVTATVMAVGYGDIYPSNSLERIFSVMVQLIGAVVFGFILSAVTAVIESSNPREIEKKKRMAEIKVWLRDRDLPPNMKTRVWAQLMYCLHQKSIFRDANIILRTLPTNLRSEIVEQTHEARIKKLQIVFGEQNRMLLVEIALCSQCFQVTQGECLLEAGEPAGDIFVVRSGRIESLLDDENMKGLEVLLATGVTEPPTSSPKFTWSHPSPGTDLLQQDEVITENILRDDSTSSDENQRPKKKDNKSGFSTSRAKSAECLSMSGPSKKSKSHPEECTDYILCGVYLEGEAFCDFPVNPVRLEAGGPRSEIIQIPKHELNHLFSRHHAAAITHEERMTAMRIELWKAATSPEWKPQHGHIRHRHRINSLVMYRGIATHVRELPAEILGLSIPHAVARRASSSDDPVLIVVTRRISSTPYDPTAERRSSKESISSSPFVAPTGTIVRHKRGRRTTITGLKVEMGNETESELLRRYIIPPQHSLKVRWDIFVGGLIFYSAVIIPTRFAFGLQKGGVALAIDVCVDLCFAIDMVLSFRTGFTDADGVVNTIPSDIYMHYLKTWFAVDFCSTFPFDWILENILAGGGNTRAIKLIRIVRLARLLKTMRLIKLSRLSDTANASVEVSPVVLRMSTLMCKIFFLAHLLSCIWFYLSTNEGSWEDSCEAGQIKCTKGEAPTNWVESLGDNAGIDTFWDQYVVTLYWVCTTMTTVGYGDITPTNNAERIFAIGVMVIGATVFGYIIGSIAEVTSSNTDATTVCLCMLRDYCEEQVLSQRTKSHANKHFEFWYQEMTPYGYEDTLLSSLPPALRKEVLLHIHSVPISRLCLFRRSLPDWFVAMLVRLLEPQAFSPGQTILGPDEAGVHQDIFFVYEGQAESARTWHDDTDGKHHLESEELDNVGPYGPGTAFGYEPLVHAAGLATFSVDQLYFRCSRGAPCLLYALRHGVLNDIHGVQSEFSQMVQEVLAETIVREAKRRRRALAEKRRPSGV